MVGAKNMKGKKEMEIRKPKFELGQKVVDKYGNVETVLGFNSYHFEENEYWYDVSYDGEVRIKKESLLEPYIEKPKSVWDLKEDDDYFLIFGDGRVSSEKNGLTMNMKTIAEKLEMYS